MTLRIIEAGSDDAGVVARLHTQSWQASYAGILPDDYLNNQVVTERSHYWSKALPAGDYTLVLIAVDEADPIAFVAVKEHADPDYDAMIEHLHVMPDAQGRGLGRRLMGEVAARLSSRGLNSVCLWVFEDNKSAIGFYENLGGVTDAHGIDKMAGGDAPDRRIGWHDLNALQAACNTRSGP